MRLRPNRLNNSQTGSAWLPSLIISILVLAGAGVVFVNQQNIADWWKLRGYQAPPAIASLADQTTMTNDGRDRFYVNHPELVSKTQFSDVCPTGGEQTIVLGCYHGGQGGIYLLDVTDARLSGVEEVTAAHEMLHGAYERLSAGERERIDKLLDDYYKNSLKDERILKTIDAYKISEPNDVVNEMHSIFGTEVRDLPTELEDYYKRYFDDRAKVVGYAEQYQAEFTSREQAIERYDTRLDSLKQQIESGKAELEEQEATIDAEQAELNQLRRSNVSAYNAAVPGYNALIDEYNAQIAEVESLVAQHNNLVTERNDVALEAEKLIDEISSSKAKPIN